MVIQRLSFPIMRIRKPPCQGRLKPSPPQLSSPVGTGMRNLVTRYVNLSFLSTQVRPYIRLPSGQRGRYLFVSFLSERRTPARRRITLGNRGNYIIRILPGKPVVISTYISFHWYFLLLFMYTVFLSFVPVCSFQVI
jgi:hypothetical protein